MTDVQPGQTYTSNTGGSPIRVVQVDRSYYLGASAWVENTDGPKRARWVSLRKLHADDKPRKTDYTLHSSETTRNDTPRRHHGQQNSLRRR